MTCRRPLKLQQQQTRQTDVFNAVLCITAQEVNGSSLQQETDTKVTYKPGVLQEAYQEVLIPWEGIGNPTQGRFCFRFIVKFVCRLAFKSGL